MLVRHGSRRLLRYLAVPGSTFRPKTFQNNEGLLNPESTVFRYRLGVVFVSYLGHGIGHRVELFCVGPKSVLEGVHSS